MTPQHHPGRNRGGCPWQSRAQRRESPTPPTPAAINSAKASRGNRAKASLGTSRNLAIVPREAKTPRGPFPPPGLRSRWTTCQRARPPTLPSTQLPLQVPPRLLFQGGFCDLSGSPMTWASLLPLPSPQHVFWEVCWPTKWPGSASGQGGVPSRERNPSPTSPYPSLDRTMSKPTTAMEGGRGIATEGERGKRARSSVPYPALVDNDHTEQCWTTVAHLPCAPSPPHTMSRDGPWEEGSREELK